ncbi:MULTISPECIES: family 43 glycosylhydrolase [unclassified Facklamia]|uniref:family 43 glycosylhydrolase n=1 Tax=Aerococcaceae TaxID=186827 RepID=UPI0013BE559F|nr:MULTISPECIES: family 43 glycosylhydrolase [unclassified Facklamia]NEW64377.1 family 43 glycosylhydrolase [Facklamia sp. 252]NEW67786.1 family 43 glycosylhydrolase [Facklamia sp. 253]QQD64838.1 family 43 glycosylhydrolase [Aerococcaceae bacterium zg-252]
MKNNSFKPGKVWLDTNGNRIQAHGGSVIHIEGIYYWYGENKEKTDGKNGIWHWGVRCYSSTDLYNWKDEGIIIPPELEDENSSLHPTACMDRPHIIYNKKTKKYVCWLKIMNSFNEQTETILIADHILGPYIKVKEGLKPLGMNAGDFDLAVAPDGKAYYYFERVHSETICADLTDDYTDVTGYYSTHFPRIHPPYVREATAHFYRNGKHYLLTSGTTGYLPNPSEIAISDTWHGPYTVQGNPHVGDESNTSFYSQISSVFKVEGKKDLYIACADRWLPNEMHRSYDVYKEMFEKIFQGREDEFDFSKMGDYPVENTSIADYVWLPIRFEGEKVFIDWHDEWTLDDYE